MTGAGQSLFDRVAGHLDELPGARNPSLRRFREAAVVKFRAAGFPTLRHEAWKYTDLSRVAAANYDIRVGGVAAVPDESALADLPLAEISPLRCVFIDGVMAPGLSRLTGLPAGASITGLRGLLDDPRSDIVAQALAQPALETPQPFGGLNDALIDDGVVITVDPDVVFDHPVHLMFVAYDTGVARLTSPRIVIRAGGGSKLQVIENYCGRPGANGLVNALTDIRAEANASVQHYRVQGDDVDVNHIGNILVAVRRGASVTSNSIVLRGQLTRVEVNADLLEPGASVKLDGIFLAGTGQHIDHHTHIRHRAGETSSAQNYKGIADGNGRGVFNGKVTVEQDAQKIRAFQSSKNLLLSKTAEIDTKPELEIYADDVQVAHGATVGQLDLQALFYLRSRGISESAAKAILTSAFAGDVLKQIDIPGLREWLERRVFECLGTSYATGEIA
jgi:Fe-S cluster assembly protein SufD